MNWSERERLYNLLPAVHRIRDGESGEAMRALLAVIESELETIESDIEGLYDNWFIETCDAWVIPYIGDLVANRPLHEVTRPRRADVAKTISYRRRKATVQMLADMTRDVTGWEAHVVEFFQLLAWTQDVNHPRFTLSPNPIPFDGIPSIKLDPADGPTAVERLNPSAVVRVGTVNFRHLDLADRVDGPFDELAHTVDVRPPCQTRDRYNIRKVGVYLWRLQSYEVEAAAPAPSAGALEDGTTFGFHFSPLGADAPLFNRAQVSETKQCDRIKEINVSSVVRPLALHLDLERCRTNRVAGAVTCTSDFVGDERAISIVNGETPVPPEKIVVMDLETWHRPPSKVKYPLPGGGETELDVEAGVDPVRGRLVFASGSEPDAVTVSYHCGFSADLGGGPYRRELNAEAGDGAEPTWSKTVSLRLGASEANYDDLDTALADWAALADDLRGVLTILDNATYSISETIVLASQEQLVIQAASGTRPTIRVTSGDLIVELAAGDSGDGGSLVLGGLLIEGGVQVTGPLRKLDVIHSTLVPGRRLDELGAPVDPDAPSIAVEPGNARLDVRIDHSIVGSLRLPKEVKSLAARDSTIDALTQLEPGAPKPAISQDKDGKEPGPPTTLERVTVFGGVSVNQLTLASEVIFTQPVFVERRQIGCVRFSFVPPGSVTPRRYRCQADLAIKLATESTLETRKQREVEKIEKKGGVVNQAAIEQLLRDRIRQDVLCRVRPSFTSCRYGDPGYAQLRHSCPAEIRTGAEDGSEMGAFSTLKQPQREANLRQRLEEYLPFGMEATLLFVI